MTHDSQLPNDEVQRLFERYVATKRVLPEKQMPPLTFVRYIEAPEFYDEYYAQRLRDWAQNPRFLNLTQADLRLN